MSDIVNANKQTEEALVYRQPPGHKFRPPVKVYSFHPLETKTVQGLKRQSRRAQLPLPGYCPGLAQAGPRPTPLGSKSRNRACCRENGCSALSIALDTLTVQ